MCARNKWLFYSAVYITTHVVINSVRVMLVKFLKNEKQVRFLFELNWRAQTFFRYINNFPVDFNMGIVEEIIVSSSSAIDFVSTRCSFIYSFALIFCCSFLSFFAILLFIIKNVFTNTLHSSKALAQSRQTHIFMETMKRKKLIRIRTWTALIHSRCELFWRLFAKL